MIIKKEINVTDVYHKVTRQQFISTYLEPEERLATIKETYEQLSLQKAFQK